MRHRQRLVSEEAASDQRMPGASSVVFPPAGRQTQLGGRRLSRRVFLQMAGASIATAAVSACAPRPAGTAPHEDGKIQLVYQDCRCLGEQFLLADFHEEHPDIEVFYIPDPENSDEKMLADMQAGIAPDVFSGCCEMLPIWAEEGYLLNLHPYVEADLDAATIADWDAAQYASFLTPDGMRFALPKYHGALALYYNKELFDEYGVAYPDNTWDHDTYLEAMRRLTADRNGDGKIDLWGSMADVAWDRLQIHVNGWGGHFVDPEDPTRSLMAGPEAMAAMEWIRARIWDDHVMANKLDIQNLETRHAFIQQSLAMVEDGSWALRDILELAPFRIGVAPFPAGPQRRVTLATTDGFAVYSGTKHPEAAWELMKFFVSPEYGRAMAEAQLLQPARASLVNEWVEIVRTQYPEQSQEIDIGAFAEGHIQGYSVTAEIFANMAEARRLALAAWEEIYTLGQARVDIIKNTSAMIEMAQPGRSQA